MHKTTVIIWLIVITSVSLVFVLNAFSPLENVTQSSQILLDFADSWVARLGLNLIGYAFVFVPGYLILRYVKGSNYLDTAGRGCTRQLVALCFYGNTSLVEPVSGDTDSARKSSTPASLSSISDTKTTRQRVLTLLFCFVGLQGSYLTWGILQEKIMTLDYSVESDSSAIALTGAGVGGVAIPTTERFTDSQFLVFVNRILAFLLSGVYLLVTAARQPRHRAPLYQYSYCSFSNIMSSWCQYEALKFVSFPTQVLAKASKIIPVMLMGKLVSRRSYAYNEYVTALLISAGTAMFMLGNGGAGERSSTDTHLTTLSGLVILSGYMAFDSFTSNWQGELFGQHRMTPLQMMCGVNLFSCLFTAVSLFQQGSFVASAAFLLRHHRFAFDIVVLSVTSALGQLFIFYTINQFGAVVFVIVMTVRQGLAILLSCLIYGHAVSAVGVLGIVLVFVAIFLRIYCSQRQKQQQQAYQKVATSAPHKV